MTCKLIIENKFYSAEIVRRDGVACIYINKYSEARKSWELAEQILIDNRPAFRNDHVSIRRVKKRVKKQLRETVLL